MSPGDMAARSQELFDRGFRDLESRFDSEPGLVRNAFLPERHMPHPSIWYAHCLLVRGDAGDALPVEDIISRALSLQERREGDPHRGNFRWFLEDEVVTDLNACQFVLEALAHLLTRTSDRLSHTARDRITGAMRLAYEEAEKLDVHWTYTNIYLLDVQNGILGGQLLGDDSIRRRGEQRLVEWADQTTNAGAPHEFNSPTYSAVQINALATIAQFAKSESTRRLVLEMEQFVWRHVARFWHAPTMQLGGPHSRAYRRDVTGAPGFFKVVLYKLLGDPRLLAPTPYFAGPDTEGEVQVALTESHCPPDAETLFRETEARDVRKGVGSRLTLAAHVRPQFSLGTMSRPYGVGAPAEPWPQHNSCILYYSKMEPPGYGVLFCRYPIHAGPAGLPSRDSVPEWLDIWDDGTFRTAQTGARAVVAYGLSPRGQRPIESLRLDIRLLGPANGGEITVGNHRYQAGGLEVPSRVPIVISDGDVHIGIIPLEPTRLGHGPDVIVWRDGQEVVISILNYQGPPKVFWEYRSLAGPFFKGNVCNGFVLWVARCAEFGSAREFTESLRSLSLKDELDGDCRHIEWGDGPGAVVLDYDLKALRPRPAVNAGEPPTESRLPYPQRWLTDSN